MKKTERQKSWPHWRKFNVGLFIGALALYVGLYGVMCWLAHPRVAFLILTITAAASTMSLLWIAVNHKDRNETEIQ